MNTKPAVLIVFGATGDLMSKKIIPSLYSLFKNNKLPEAFKVIGVGRSDYNGERFCSEIVVKSIREHLDEDFPDDQCFTFFEYLQGDINELGTYEDLRKRLDQLDNVYGEESNKLFYYSVYSDLYETLTKNIHEITTSKDKVRLMIEKPYGTNEVEAIKLDTGIKKYFDEENIYRIDHYLEKEVLRQIESFKNSEKYAEIWNADYISKIENVAWEDFGVEGRGKFYEGVGALLDVGQNHLLSILALVLSKTGEDQRFLRADALHDLPILSHKQIETQTKRSQYNGYLNIEDVASDSEIETYFKLDFALKGEWSGVNVVMEAGKGLPAQKKYLSIHFEDEELIFEYYPTACVYTKSQSGKKKEIQCASTEHQYVAEYSQVILDAIAMDPRQFLSIDEVLAQWKFVDPIRDAWDEDLVELKNYEKGTVPD